MPDTDPVSFQRDVLPLFREIDVQHMAGFGVMLNDYAYMSNPANAQAVLDTLTGAPPLMPPGGPYWSDDQVKLFSKWMSDGYKP